MMDPVVGSNPTLLSSPIWRTAKVNVEVDMIAKYVEKLAASPDPML
jgi:riboflavin synthase alpha subunit